MADERPRARPLQARVQLDAQTRAKIRLRSA